MSSIVSVGMDLEEILSRLQYVSAEEWRKIKDHKGITPKEMELVSQTLKAIHQKVFGKPADVSDFFGLEGELALLMEQYADLVEGAWEDIILEETLPLNAARALRNILKKAEKKADKIGIDLDPFD